MNLLLFSGRKKSYQQRVKALLGAALLGYWPLGESSGTVAKDASGHGWDGTYNTAVTGTVAGIEAGKTAVNLNAAMYVDVYSAGLAAAFNGAEGFAAHWLTVNAGASWTDGSVYISMHMTGDAGNSLYMLKAAAGEYDTNLTAGASMKTPLAVVMAGTRLIHLGYVWSKSGDYNNAYVNGTKQRPVTGLGTWAGALASPAKFGSHTNHGSKWPGAMQHCILANAAPSDAVMRALAKTTGQVVFVGDSRSTGAKGWSFPAVDLAYTAGSIGYGGRGVGNWAVAGFTWAQLAAEAATIDALLINGQSNILVVWAGVNYGTDTTGAQIYARIAAYCSARKAAGWKVVICTEIDCQDAAHNTFGWHGTAYPALNALLAADHSFAAGYVDLGAVVNLQDATNLTYFLADNLHLQPAGYALVRNAVAAVLAAI